MAVMKMTFIEIRILKTLMTFVLAIAATQGPNGFAQGKVAILGPGVISCSEFNKKVIEIKKTRNKIVENRKDMPIPEVLNDGQIKGLQEVRNELLFYQDAIDSWFESTFDGYAKGVMQAVTSVYYNRVNYVEMMNHLNGYRYTVMFAEFCENPAVAKERFHGFVNLLAADATRILVKAPNQAIGN